MFQNKPFKNVFQEHYQRVTQSGSDQERRFLGPDWGPICLQRLSAAASKEKEKGRIWSIETDSYL